jgi:ribosomal protein S1
MDEASTWTKKINHPSEVQKMGDKVECIVMDIDKEKRRISLSMKQPSSPATWCPRPWLPWAT